MTCRIGQCQFRFNFLFLQSGYFPFKFFTPLQNIRIQIIDLPPACVAGLIFV